MPIIKSAKKRVRTSNKAAIRNSKTKRSLKTALKSFRAAVTSGDKAAGSKHSAAQSELDKAAKKGVLHKNKVARLKKQAAKHAKAAGVKPAANKTTTKTVKAGAPKKAAPAKKPVTKKPVAKKTRTSAKAAPKK